MKRPTEAAHKGRVAQGGLSRNGRIYCIAKCLSKNRRPQLPLFGRRYLAPAANDPAYTVKETRRQVRFLYDKITKKKSQALLINGAYFTGTEGAVFGRAATGRPASLTWAPL